MTALSREFAGAGAMLARLVDLGSRAGLSATQTLLHVLDGAPLPGPPAAPASVADIVDRMRAADHVVVSTEMAREAERHARMDIDIGQPIVQFLRNDEISLGGLLTIEEALQPSEKREKIANLYGSTALRNGRLAELTGSTPGSVSFFLNEFRKAGDPRIIRGDRLRGINLSGTETPAEAPMAVDGVGEDCATALPSKSDDILPAGFNEEGRRADLVPDVLPEGARECAERDAEAQSSGGDVAAFPAPPAVQEDAQEKGTVRQQETTLEAPEPADTAARPAGPGQDLPDTADGMVGGFPVAAAPSHAEETGDEGVDSASTPTGGESAAEEAGFTPPAELASSSSPSSDRRPDLHERLIELYDTTERTQRDLAAELGLKEYKASEILKSARSLGDARVSRGDSVRAEIKARKLAEEKAARDGRAKAAAQQPTATDEIVRLWRDTLLKQSEIGERVGKSTPYVGAIISQKRKAASPDIRVGDQARLKAEAERLKPVEPAEPPPQPVRTAASPLESAPAAIAQPSQDAPPASRRARDVDHPGDLVLLKQGEVLAVDRGWIVGPAGVLKGFPLINAVLMTLAAGELFDATVVAKKCAVRSGDAVLAQLSHWKADLGTIGVEVVRVGKADVRLRRA